MVELQSPEDLNAMADLLEGKTPPPAAPPVAAPETPVAPQAPAEPVTPTTPNEPTSPANTPPAQPPISFDDELVTITGGAIKSREEIAAIIDKANQLPDFESRLKAFETENTELKAKVATDPFANDYTRRLNELYKSNASESQIQAFTTLNKVADLEGLSAIDARLLALQIKEGLSEEDAKIYLGSQYKLDPDLHAPDVIKAEEIRLKVDANGDREFLKTHKAEVSKVPADPAEQQQVELQQKQTEHVAKLTPIAKSVTNTAADLFKGLSLNGKEGDQNITADFEVSAESLKSIEPLVKSFIENNWQNLPADENGLKEIQGYVKNLLIIQNFDAIRINAAAQRELQVRAEYTNPTPINRGPAAPNPGKSSREEFDAKLVDQY